MTKTEFNNKWFYRLEPTFYGLDISNKEVVDYLNKKFEELEKLYPNFTYSQIKVKYDMVRVYIQYVPTSIIIEIEEKINEIL